MPKAEAAHLAERYRNARVILEYGSGGSTRIASQMQGKLVLSVESDRVWARNLRREIAASAPKSQVIVHHVDIGPTGPWGRARDESGWRRYHLYPNEIWDMPYFRHPDVILIDGRFRTACLMAAMMRITRPVPVLFDDYADRPKYRLVERLVRPEQVIGRMAEFSLVPGMANGRDIGFVFEQFFDVTVHGQGKRAYELDETRQKGPEA